MTAKSGLDESSKWYVLHLRFLLLVDQLCHAFSYAILRTAFQELKASYDSSQAFVLEARATLADFNDSRQSASATIEGRSWRQGSRYLY